MRNFGSLCLNEKLLITDNPNENLLLTKPSIFMNKFKHENKS